MTNLWAALDAITADRTNAADEARRPCATCGAGYMRIVSAERDGERVRITLRCTNGECAATSEMLVPLAHGDSVTTPGNAPA